MTTVTLGSVNDTALSDAKTATWDSNHRRTLCILRYRMVGWSYVQGFPPDVYKRESHEHR